MATTIKDHLNNKHRPSQLLVSIFIDVTGHHESRSQYDMKQHVCRQYGHVACHGADAEEVKQEVSRVLGADAVVHPNAVVIKTLDTSIADPCKENTVQSATLVLVAHC